MDTLDFDDYKMIALFICLILGSVWVGMNFGTYLGFGFFLAVITLAIFFEKGE